MRLANGLLIFCLMLVALPFSLVIQTTRGFVGGAPCAFLNIYTSTGGGGITLNKTAWPDPSHNWTMTLSSGTSLCYCGEGVQLPMNSPITMAAFEPKGYPFIRWDTTPRVGGWVTLSNSTSNPTNITVSSCSDGRIVAVFNGPATSLPTSLTFLLGIMAFTDIAAWSRKRKQRGSTYSEMNA